MTREKCIDKVYARVEALVEFLRMEDGSATTNAARENFPAWDDNQFYYTVSKARQMQLIKPQNNKRCGVLTLHADVRLEPLARTRPTPAFSERRV